MEADPDVPAEAVAGEHLRLDVVAEAEGLLAEGEEGRAGAGGVRAEEGAEAGEDEDGGAGGGRGGAREDEEVEERLGEGVEDGERRLRVREVERGRQLSRVGAHRVRPQRTQMRHPVVDTGGGRARAVTDARGM